MLVDCPGGAYLSMLGDLAQLDVAVVVVEPYPRSGEVARRLLERFSENTGPTRVVVVANKIGEQADLDAARGFLPGLEIDIVVPLDAGVVVADAEGRAPIDVAPEGPAVQAIEALVGFLELPTRGG